jgi:hypothetical protein
MSATELQHWGILGMKWGRRKAESVSNSGPANNQQRRKNNNQGQNRNRNRNRNRNTNQNSQRVDRAFNKAINTRHQDINIKQYKVNYKKVLESVVVGGILITAVGALVRPTAALGGASIAGKIGKLAAARSGNILSRRNSRKIFKAGQVAAREVGAVNKANAALRTNLPGMLKSEMFIKP